MVSGLKLGGSTILDELCVCVCVRVYERLWTCVLTQGQEKGPEHEVRNQVKVGFVPCRRCDMGQGPTLKMSPTGIEPGTLLSGDVRHTVWAARI